MSNLAVWRLPANCAEPLRVGTIDRSDPYAPTFAYAPSYLAVPDAIPISLSLPLAESAYDAAQLRPYFEGLLPEGRSRSALAQAAQTPDDYLTLLAAGGLDCAGDVALCPEDAADAFVAQVKAQHAAEVAPGTQPTPYTPLSTQALRTLLADHASLAAGNLQAGTLLAGARGKTALAHDPQAPIADGWLAPAPGAASTHVLKAGGPQRVTEFELLCMGAAPACGVQAAPTSGFFLGAPVVCSQRFDRWATVDEGGNLQVARLPQEDVSQALGLLARDRRGELEGGTYHAVAQLLYERSASTMADIEQLARRAVYDYLIGNCANHLRKLAVVYTGEWLRLAPAYGLVSTTPFPRFSREMARRLGSTRDIDRVEPGDFALLARDLGLGVKRVRRICAELCDAVVPAVRQVGAQGEEALLTLPYAAEDLVSDMNPRLTVVQLASLGG